MSAAASSSSIITIDTRSIHQDVLRSMPTLISLLRGQQQLIQTPTTGQHRPPALIDSPVRPPSLERHAVHQTATSNTECAGPRTASDCRSVPAWQSRISLGFTRLISMTTMSCIRPAIGSNYASRVDASTVWVSCASPAPAITKTTMIAFIRERAVFQLRLLNRVSITTAFAWWATRTNRLPLTLNLPMTLLTLIRLCYNLLTGMDCCVESRYSKHVSS